MRMMLLAGLLAAGISVGCQERGVGGGGGPSGRELAGSTSSPSAVSEEAGDEVAAPAEASSAPSGTITVGVVKKGKEPAEVELSNPVVRIDERGIFWFQVKYRFVQGRPTKHYLLTVHFPGTKNLCLKHMEAWELKGEGEIKDGIPLYEQPIETYEIVLSEADSPMNEYKPISNTVAGTMRPAPATREPPGEGSPALPQDESDNE